MEQGISWCLLNTCSSYWRVSEDLLVMFVPLHGTQTFYRTLIKQKETNLIDICFSHGHCRKRAVSFRLCLTQLWRKIEGGPLVVQSRSPGRESAQRLCTCFVITCLYWTNYISNFLVYQLWNQQILLIIIMITRLNKTIIEIFNWD